MTGEREIERERDRARERDREGERERDKDRERERDRERESGETWWEDQRPAHFNFEINEGTGERAVGDVLAVVTNYTLSHIPYNCKRDKVKILITCLNFLNVDLLNLSCPFF